MSHKLRFARFAFRVVGWRGGVGGGKVGWRVRSGWKATLSE